MDNPGLRAARLESRRLVEAWIAEIVDGDGGRGRTQDEFGIMNKNGAMRAASTAMGALGYETYSGNGNMFHVKHDAYRPVVVHIRPLAERVVRLRFV